VNKQLDNTPLNYISNDYSDLNNNNLINQIDLRLNENNEQIINNLNSIKNNVTVAITNFEKIFENSLNDNKIELLSSVNNMSNLINEM